MKKELISDVSAFCNAFETGNLSDRQLVDLKFDVNVLKSKLYVHIDSFENKSECYLYINTLNSLLDKINFELDYNYKLLMKIREKAVILFGNNWKDFLKECKNEL